MGDDAEYYMEQQEQEARLKQASEYEALDRNRKSLLCWTDTYEDEVWCWEPLTSVNSVFSSLYTGSQIGSDYFLASGIPVEGGEDWEVESPPAEAPDLSVNKTIDGLRFCVAKSDTDATHEVIVVSRKEAALLRAEADLKKGTAKSLHEEMISEMLEEMAAYIEAESQQNIFVFAREI